MGEHLFKNWIIYVLLCGFIWFIASIYIRAHRDEAEKKGKDTKSGIQ